MDHEPDVRRVTGPVASLRTDDHLGPIVESVGPLESLPHEPFFERFVRSIIRQQVSMASATAIENRLHEAITVSPEQILEADTPTLREVGLSERKIATIRGVAERFETNTWDRATFRGRSGRVVIEELTSVTGVGVWTAKMQLIFSLGRPDVFPVEDLGIRRAMESLWDEDMTRDEMRTAAERWAPYRSDASRYLWKANDDWFKPKAT